MNTDVTYVSDINQRVGRLLMYVYTQTHLFRTPKHKTMSVSLHDKTLKVHTIMFHHLHRLRKFVLKNMGLARATSTGGEN